ncbi:MAG: hypothetical protein MZV49_24300 [Rhodopseudomonas palustris]|nr:hypothetical protein [Rhodopseudomonas palustris]
MGLGILLASLAAPLVGSIFGGNKSTAPFKGWMSPSLGMQDPYLLNAMYKRGLQYGIGDQDMFADIQKALSNEWPQIMRQYGDQGFANKLRAR